MTALVGGVLLAVPAYALPAALRVRGRAPFLMAVLLVMAADVVLVFVALSLLEALTTPAILLGQGVIAAASAVAWLGVGRPRSPSGWRLGGDAVARAAKRHPAIAMLAAAVALALAVQLVVALLVVPNKWDSMTYHLARAGYWLQEQSAGYFAGGHVRQLANPPTARCCKLGRSP